MKKLIAIMLVLVMSLTVFAGCASGDETSTTAGTTAAPETTATPADTGAEDALDYIKTVYKKAAEVTAKDFERIGTVPMGDVKYDVVWTASVSEDLIKISVGENGMAVIDVNEDAEENTPYTLTATITGADGVAHTASWEHTLPAGMDVDGLTYEQIVNLVYALEDGVSTEDPYRLFGTITEIYTPWSDEYQNITVNIQVGDMADKIIQCYRLSGEGAKDLAVGDQITVEGVLKNYKGTYEFDKGCVLVGMGEHVDQKALVKTAFALGDGATMDYPAVMTGTVTEIVSAWSDEYGNITVNFQVEDQVMQAYRLSGEGAKDLAVGDQITVAGIIKNYKGLIEFDKGCKLVPNDAYHSVKNALSAYKLEDGAAQEAAKTITGTVVSIDSAWSDEYQNITVTIVVAGLEDYPIQCYRLAGEGAKDLAEGSVVTVTGILKNYKGTYEFDKGCTLDAVQ